MVESIKIASAASIPVNTNNNRQVTPLEPEINKQGGNSGIENSGLEPKQDRIELSNEAKGIIEANENTETRRVSDDEVQTARLNVERNSIEFRGLKNIEKQRDLNEFETSRVDEIRQSVQDAFQGVKEISDKDIFKIAETAIQKDQTTAFSLVQKLEGGDITNQEFDKLSQINRNINKANGFGIKEFSPQEDKQIKLAEGEKKNILQLSDGEKRLNRTETQLLEQFETVLSAIEDFKLNVKDTIGPEGLVA